MSNSGPHIVSPVVLFVRFDSWAMVEVIGGDGNARNLLRSPSSPGIINDAIGSVVEVSEAGLSAFAVRLRRGLERAWPDLCVEVVTQLDTLP